MDDFNRALTAQQANCQYEEKLMQFGQFLGEWDFRWEDRDENGHERKVKGEWIFSWVLEGTAIQDVFICPSREERLNPNMPKGEYGTTIRIYNPKKDAWDVFYGCTGEATMLEAKSEGDKIVLSCLNEKNFLMKWVFSQITEMSFHWQNISSSDGGVTWKVNKELFATRRLKI